MICPYCASETPDGSRFCCRCASRLPETVPQDVPPVAVQDIPPAAEQDVLPAAEQDVSPAAEQDILPAAEQDILPAAEQDVPPVAEQAPVPAPVKKKGRLWPPIVILAVMFAAGLWLFLTTGSPSAVRDPAQPWFSVDNGTLYFDCSRYTGGSELTVPATVAGQTVTAIGDECFYNCGSLTAVHLPDGVKSIGSRAFSGCTSMRGILLPDSLTAIGAGAFAGCYDLEAVCIPATVTRAGTGIFKDCGKLVHVFYSGLFDSLDALGIGFENPQVRLYCADGTYHLG